MRWSPLPRGQKLESSPELLERTICRLLLRYGALCPSMISVLLRVPISRVIAVLDILQARSLVHQRESERPSDPRAYARTPWQLAA